MTGPAAPSPVPPGTPVRFVTDSPYGLGVLSLREAIEQPTQALNFRSRAALDGDVGIYHSALRVLTEWHLITVRLADDPDQHLVVPVHLDQFAVIV